MTNDDPKPPVADDDFPEFAEPPRHKPAASSPALAPRAVDEPDGDVQAAVDDVVARIKKRKAEGGA